MLDKLNLFYFSFHLYSFGKMKKKVKVTSCHHTLLILLTTLDYIIDM